MSELTHDTGKEAVSRNNPGHAGDQGNDIYWRAYDNDGGGSSRKSPSRQVQDDDLKAAWAGDAGRRKRRVNVPECKGYRYLLAAAGCRELVHR